MMVDISLVMNKKEEYREYLYQQHIVHNKFSDAVDGIRFRDAFDVIDYLIDERAVLDDYRRWAAKEGE